MYSGVEGAFKIASISIILVFIILSLLAALVMGVQKIINLTSKKNIKEDSTLNLNRETKNIKKPTFRTNVQKGNEPNEILIAVITASIANYIEGNAKQVKIINIKRALPNNVNPWTIAGFQNRIFNKVSISPRKEGGL